MLKNVGKLVENRRKEQEQYLFRVVYETCRYFGITPKMKTKEMKEFNDDVADLVMLNLINIDK